MRKETKRPKGERLMAQQRPKWSVVSGQWSVVSSEWYYVVSSKQ
jgi:hypothetical protein